MTNRAAILDLLFSVGDHAAALRRDLETVAHTLTDCEREHFLRMLHRIESRNAELMLALPVHRRTEH